MSIVVLNPVGEPRKSKAGLATRLDALNGKTIGILDDGFGGTVPDTFKRLEEIIRQKFPDTRLKRWKKPVLSQPSPSAMIKEITSTVDGVIVGVAA